MKKSHVILIVAVISCHCMNSHAQQRFERDRESVFQKYHMHGQVGSVVTVGDDLACDYSVLQDAIAAQPAEIRLANNKTYDASTINSTNIGFPLTLVGGFDDCIDATNNIIGLQKSVIASSSNTSTLILDGTHNINLANLIIQDGEFGLFVTAAFTGVLSIYNVSLTANYIGLELRQVQGYTIAEDLIVEENDNPLAGQSSKGSGIACRSPGLLYVVGNSSISNNTSDYAAGVYLKDGCEMIMVGGNDPNLGNGISANIADKEGAGVYIENDGHFIATGGLLEIEGINYGDQRYPFNVSDNSTLGQQNGLGRGGAFYAAGSDAVIELTNVSITNNNALQGGGFNLRDGASVKVSDSKECWSDIGCNHILNNRSIQAGGAFFIFNGSTVELRGARIEQNRASRGMFALINGSNSELTIESSFLTKNGNNGQGSYADQSLVTVENNGVFNGVNLTVADNASTDHVFINNSATLMLAGSYVYNPLGGPFLTTQNQASSQLNCLLLDDTNNLAGQNYTLMSQSEYVNTFVDPGLSDYHTLETAVGIDFCSDFGAAQSDIDFEITGVDDPTRVDIDGVFDVGADENLASDPLFKDGFDQSIKN